MPPATIAATAAGSIRCRFGLPPPITDSSNVAIAEREAADPAGWPLHG